MEDAFEALENSECRVAGGTMSTNAAIRSKNDSSVDIWDETDDIDAEDDVREESEEA